MKYSSCAQRNISVPFRSPLRRVTVLCKTAQSFQGVFGSWGWFHIRDSLVKTLSLSRKPALED